MHSGWKRGMRPTSFRADARTHASVGTSTSSYFINISFFFIHMSLLFITANFKVKQMYWLWYFWIKSHLAIMTRLITMMYKFSLAFPELNKLLDLSLLCNRLTLSKYTLSRIPDKIAFHWYRNSLVLKVLQFFRKNVPIKVSRGV